MLKWQSRGRVFPPAGAELPPWIRGYGTAPFAVPAGDGTARVFFSGRDANDRGHVAACTLDLERLTVDAVSLTASPLVAPGPPGAFDESGCTMACIVRRGEQWLLYYTGWMLGRTVPFYLAVGLAVSNDGGRTFQKHSPAPLLERTAVDPFLTASPSILIEDGLWRMWYVSAVEWQGGAGALRHRYLIKYAESRDGIAWTRDGRVAIGFESPDEYAFGRPHVMHADGRYHMWYCVRGERYRIGYAHSADGLQWTRRDGDVPPPGDWDSDMQAYPMVLRDGGRWIMLYSGNGYGATGFGCAVAESGGDVRA